MQQHVSNVRCLLCSSDCTLVPTASLPVVVSLAVIVIRSRCDKVVSKTGMCVCICMCLCVCEREHDYARQELEQEARDLQRLVDEGLAALDEQKRAHSQALQALTEELAAQQQMVQASQSLAQEAENRAQEERLRGEGSVSAAQAAALQGQIDEWKAASLAAQKELESSKHIHAANVVAVREELGR